MHDGDLVGMDQRLAAKAERPREEAVRVRPSESRTSSQTRSIGRSDARGGAVDDERRAREQKLLPVRRGSRPSASARSTAPSSKTCTRRARRSRTPREARGRSRRSRRSAARRLADRVRPRGVAFGSTMPSTPARHCGEIVLVPLGRRRRSPGRAARPPSSPLRASRHASSRATPFSAGATASSRSAITASASARERAHELALLASRCEEERASGVKMRHPFDRIANV